MDEKELDKMAKDIEPIEEPKEDVKTENPDGFVEDKETYVKPDGETTTTPVRTPNVIKEESGGKKWVLRGLATVLILGLGAASAWLYTDAQSARNELHSTKTGLEAARNDAAQLRTDLTKAKADTKPSTETGEVTKDETEVLAKTAATALEAATLSTGDVATVGKVIGDFALIYTGLPNKDGVPHVFKNTKKGLVEIAILSDTGMGGGLPKHEANQLKENYGFDATLFGIKIAE